MLKRKIDLCENYVSVYSKVEPSLYTKWRGRILEEMVGPIAMLAKKRYETKQVKFGRQCAVSSCLLTLSAISWLHESRAGNHATFWDKNYAFAKKNSVRPRINELHCLQINKGEFNVAVVKCLGLIRQAVKCRQFERPAAAAVTDGIGGNKAAIAAIMKEFNDIVSSVKAP